MTSVSYIAPCKSNVAGLLRVKVLVTATCPKLRFTTLITKGGSEEICTSYLLYQRLYTIYFLEPTPHKFATEGSWYEGLLEQ